MTRFASTGYSRLASSREAVDEALTQAQAGLQGQAHSTWVMASHHHQQELGSLCAGLPGQVFGGTAYGAITQAGESEEEPGLGLMLLSHPKLRLRSAALSVSQETPDEINWGRALGRRLGSAEAAWLFLTHRGWSEAVSEGLAELLPGAVVAGAGLTGGWEGPRVFSEGESQDPLAWAVALSGTEQVEWTLAQALAPLDSYVEVSSLVGDRLRKLAGRPAAEVALEQLGESRYEEFCQGQLPLYARVPHGESGKADRLFAVNGVDPKSGGLFVAGLPEGTPTLSLALCDGRAAREEFRVQLSQLKARMPDPEFAVYLNCCARGQDLYGELGVDAALFAQTFPDVPMLGLSGGFELAPRHPGARLCSYTGILMVVR